MSAMKGTSRASICQAIDKKTVPGPTMFNAGRIIAPNALKKVVFVLKNGVVIKQ